MSTQGCWFNMLMVMWDEKEQGKINGTKVEICRIVGCHLPELRRFIEDNKRHKFADVTIRNNDVTIINRRMNRAFLERESTKERVRKHRNKDVTDCNIPSSSSSSLSSSNKDNICQFDLARKLYPGTKRGLETEFVNFKKKYKEWEKLLILLIGAIHKQIDWRKSANGEFRPPWKHFKTWINNRSWEEELTTPIDYTPKFIEPTPEVRRLLQKEREA